MLKMKVSIKGDKALGQNSRKVVQRLVINGATVEGIAREWCAWRDTNSINSKRVGYGFTVQDESGIPVAHVYYDGSIGRMGDIGLVSVTSSATE